MELRACDVAEDALDRAALLTYIHVGRELGSAENGATAYM